MVLNLTSKAANQQKKRRPDEWTPLDSLAIVIVALDRTWRREAPSAGRRSV